MSATSAVVHARRRTAGRALVAAIACAGAFASPAAALASTASVTPGTLHYAAAPGEANNLFVADSSATVPNTFKLTDSGAVIHPGSGCISVSGDVHSAICTGAQTGDTRRYDISLGDRNDEAWVTSR